MNNICLAAFFLTVLIVFSAYLTRVIPQDIAACVVLTGMTADECETELNR